MQDATPAAAAASPDTPKFSPAVPADGPLWDRFLALLSSPVNPASLAFLRFALGVVMCLEATSILRPSQISGGGIPLEVYYTGPDSQFNFPYTGFGWLPLLPPEGMKALVMILGAAGLAMGVGLFYRVSAAIVFLIWGYLFAVESTRTYWQCHYYLELLFTFLMLLTPAGQHYSVDAWLKRGTAPPPPTVPFWTVFILRAQLFITYFYAGFTKLSTDWLLDASPVRWFLSRPEVLEPFRPVLSSGMMDSVRSLVESSGFAYFICYVGALYDLGIGFLLLFRRTRIFGVVLTGIFHTTNRFLIYDDIDWFPLVGFLSTLIFLDPDWPVRLWAWVRRPRFTAPDWNWFTTGGILFPVVGATLGWSLAPTRETRRHASHALPALIPVFVVGWICWQVFMPIRHFLIPGDSRVTFEGLSFSWRLKADYYRVMMAEVAITDPAILSRDGAGPMVVHWDQWKGDRAVYRNLTPGRINWPELPEIVVMIEPMHGHRIIYNPFAGSNTARSEAEAKQRVIDAWTTTYGRQPTVIQRAAPTSIILRGLATELTNLGQPESALAVTNLVKQAMDLDRNQLDAPTAGRLRADLSTLMAGLASSNKAPRIQAMLNALYPCVLAGEPFRNVPFFVIEDRALLRTNTTSSLRLLDPALWKNSVWTRGTPPSRLGSINGDPVVIYLPNTGLDGKDLLPKAYIVEADEKQGLAYIAWNYLTELSKSKSMHISTQPFYLRRYARKVAIAWEKEYGRRPVIRASTSVSLNRRPPQPMVDPGADLASVPVSWFGHNPWIRDLETRRIPREAIAGN